MTFFELAQSLLRGYLDSSDLPVEVVFAGEKHQQWSAGPYTVSVTETGATTTLINLVRKSETKTAVVDWAEWGIEPDCEVSAQLRRRFADFLDEKFFPQLTSDRQDRRDPNDRTEQKPGPDQQNILPRRLEKVRPTGPERPPDMPDFEDEYELKDTHRPAAAPPALVGDRDLYPPGLPRHPEMKPYLDPLADGPRGGMYVGPDDPMFGSQRGNTSRRGVPPGARFDDPYGEDNLDDMGMGLPGGLRGPGSGFGGPGFGPGSGFGPGGSGFGPGGSGFGSGGAGFGGSGFGF
ncbi:hypothetical protein A9F13_18g00649 [Clavispora lusitaniae]|uniref:PI31 proteasome regulator C-terminal domain-containing protein n=1 Tax=Clavispora lusitaniae TaxID=36911 RepID=A0AA91T041_CLALS|nr:hypothetical protein A9F13_18g00649 [Clavispora lusitaniae]